MSLSWSRLWIAWLIFVIGSFLIIEIAGYSRHGTLSEQVWAWLGIGQPLDLVYVARRGLLGFFLFWLFLHFYFQVA